MNEREVEAVARAIQGTTPRCYPVSTAALENMARAAIAALAGARGDGWQKTKAPTDTIILAVVPYSVQRGAAPIIAMTERYVCKIDDAGDLLTEGGDDIGWRGEDITAWRECPALPGEGK